MTLLEIINGINGLVWVIWNLIALWRRGAGPERAVAFLYEATRNPEFRKVLRKTREGERFLELAGVAHGDIKQLARNAGLLGMNLKWLLYESKIIAEEHERRAEYEAGRRRA